MFNDLTILNLLNQRRYWTRIVVHFSMNARLLGNAIRHHVVWICKLQELIIA